jgi:hypothetical protein
MTNSLPNTARAFANCDDHDVETEKGLSSRVRYFRDRAVPHRKGQAMPDGRSVPGIDRGG